MAEPAITLVEKSTVDPIPRKNFGLAGHSYQSFHATVPSDLSKDDLTSPDLWVHVATRVNDGDEIRMVAEDASWYARLYVSYSVGNRLVTHLIERVEMEDTGEVEDPEGPYFVERRRGMNWCVIQRDNGEVIYKNLPKKSAAEEQLEQLVSVLAR